MKGISSDCVEVTLKVDKLTMLGDLDDPEGCSEYLYGIITDASAQSEFGLVRARPERPYRFALAGFVPASTSPLIWSSKAAWHLSLQPRKEGIPFLRLDLNPDALTPKGQEHIRATFREGLLIDLDRDVHPVAVTRVDAALDLIGVRIGDFIWDRPGITKRKMIAGKGGIETLYLGSCKAGHLALYDKRAQAHLSGPPVTRIEYRCLHRQTPDAVVSMNNPFSKLRVASPDALKLSPSHRIAFGAHARAEGLATALAASPSSAAAARKAELAAATPDWWLPDAFWKDWGITVRLTAPFVFTSSNPDDPSGTGFPPSYQDALEATAAMAGYG